MTAAPAVPGRAGRGLRRAAVAAGVLSLLAALAWQFDQSRQKLPVPTRLALVIPDDLADDDVHVMAWRDAASELGFPMELVRASALLRLGGRREVALVVPDTVHRVMNGVLVARIDDLVRRGALLMLVHDAGVFGVDGRFQPRRSRLSELAGVDYAMYDKLGADTVVPRVAYVDAGAVASLQLPPGKLVRQDGQRPLLSGQTAPAAGEDLAVAGYHYGRLSYPVYATSGRFDGQRLLHADGNTLVAGVHRVGAGTVMFVNLPLGDLKLRTDGMLMHGLLRLFAQDVAHLPQLSPMPLARGAVVMNWHVDSSAAEPAMATLESYGAFEQGPYSVHLTAGPDVDVVGDRLGMDLPHNPRMQAWVRRLADGGHELGSHGGWIHNAFGRNIATQERSVSIGLVERNIAAVAASSGRPVREYSAPLGNHPAWLTPWLREHGLLAYYFTGDGGMAPTRSYQDRRRGPTGTWSFPVLSYGSLAGFEEASAAGVAEEDVSAWLNDVSDYCADSRTVRLVYFHPPGVTHYPAAFKSWLRHSAELHRAGRLRWITMTGYAQFASSRLAAQWQIDSAAGSPALRLDASHARSLEQMSWLVPTHRYDRPEIVSGKATVDLDGDYWRVVAGASTSLSVRLPLRAVVPTAAVSSQEVGS